MRWRLRKWSKCRRRRSNGRKKKLRWRLKKKRKRSNKLRSKNSKNFVGASSPTINITPILILNRHGYDHRTRQLQRCCSPRASERRGDSVHWKNWWISAGLQIYVQALGNFRDSETPSRQFWNPIHYLSVTSGIWELSIKFFCHSRWHVSKWILCTEKTIAIRSMYRGIFQYRDVPVF